MTLQQLQYIVTLDDTKNFSKAAAACFVTQATLSTMVKKLEEELDIVLFDRKTSPIITTDCGKEIIEAARLTLMQAHKVQDVAQKAKGKIQGRVIIGIIPTIAHSFLPIVGNTLLEKYPNLQMEFRELPTEHLLQQIKEGRLDFGIISTPFQGLKDFEQEILYYEKLYVYGNLTANKKYLIPEDIKSEKIWLLQEGNCLRDQIMSFCELKKTSKKERLSFQTSSMETLLNMVDHAGGLTLVPELYLRNICQERTSKINDFKKPFPVREISMVYYRPYAKFRLAQLLITEIKSIMLPLLKTSTLKNTEQIMVKH